MALGTWCDHGRVARAAPNESPACFGKRNRCGSWPRCVPPTAPVVGCENNSGLPGGVIGFAPSPNRRRGAGAPASAADRRDAKPSARGRCRDELAPRADRPAAPLLSAGQVGVPGARRAAHRQQAAHRLGHGDPRGDRLSQVDHRAACSRRCAPRATSRATTCAAATASPRACRSSIPATRASRRSSRWRGRCAIELTHRLKWPIGIGVIDGDAIAIKYWTGTISPWAHTNTVLGLRPDLADDGDGPRLPRVLLRRTSASATCASCAPIPRAASARRRSASSGRCWTQVRRDGYATRDPRTKPYRTTTLAVPIREGETVHALVSISIFTTAVPAREDRRARSWCRCRRRSPRIEQALAFTHTGAHFPVGQRAGARGRLVLGGESTRAHLSSRLGLVVGMPPSNHVSNLR